MYEMRENCSEARGGGYFHVNFFKLCSPGGNGHCFFFLVASQFNYFRFHPVYHAF